MDRLLGEWGIQRDSLGQRRRFEQGMEERKLEELQAEDREWRELRRGWCWGGRTFREELLELIGEAQAEHHYGEELLESAELEAERFIEEMLREVGWKQEQLGAHRKADKHKVDRSVLASADDDELEMDCRQVAHGSLADRSERCTPGPLIPKYALIHP